MPAKELLPAISRRKYGLRKDQIIQGARGCATGQGELKRGGFDPQKPLRIN
jgi:hypothetical protein